MRKIIEKLKDKNLYFCLLITLVFFGIFIQKEFAVDSYSMLESHANEMFNHFASIGRFVIGIWQTVVTKLGFNFELIYLNSFLIAILCITLAIYNLYLVINKKVKNNAVCLAVSTVTIINPFTIELFLFIEKGIFALTVLMTVLAFVEFTKFLEGNKKAFKYVLLFMFIATFGYQGIIGLFIALSTIYIVLSSKNIKDFFINNVFALLGYGVPAIVNLLVIRLISSSDRVSGAINFVESINKILKGSIEMIATYTILPKYTFVILIAILIILAIILLVINKNIKISTKILKFLGLGYVFLATYAITIIPHVMENTDSIWFVPRSTYPFGAIIGIICIYILINIVDYSRTNKKDISKSGKIQIPLYFIGIICIALLIIQFYNFNKIEINHYNLNYTDKVNSLKIGEEIKKYEQETGNKITKIAIYGDKYISTSYPNIWEYKDINVTGFFPEWAIINMINYYNDLELVQAETDPQIEESFKEQNWNDFSLDQIIFIGDTIHYCRF